MNDKLTHKKGKGQTTLDAPG